MIQHYISELCDILNIPEPSVSFDTSHFDSDTMLAQCHPDGTVIYLKSSTYQNPDLLFSIAHELRHVWQIKTDKQLYFSAYKPVHLCNSTEQYNLQLAELDANAFAGIIMMDFFRLTPLFEGLSEPVKAKIYERMEYLDAIL